jgi:hypothetical protein
LGHNSGVAGKLRKVQLIHEVISVGRGSMRKPSGTCVGK